MSLVLQARINPQVWKAVGENVEATMLQHKVNFGRAPSVQRFPGSYHSRLLFVCFVKTGHKCWSPSPFMYPYNQFLPCKFNNQENNSSTKYQSSITSYLRLTLKDIYPQGKLNMSRIAAESSLPRDEVEAGVKEHIRNIVEQIRSGKVARIEWGVSDSFSHAY